jgi:hypothetical protein
MVAMAAEDLDDINFDTGFTDGQQSQVRDNTALISAREHEITNVVRVSQAYCNGHDGCFAD